MGDTPSSFAALVRRLRQGDDEAAAQIVAFYNDTLLAMARRRVGNQLGRRVDPEDLLQSTYRSFFLRAGKGEFDFPDRESLRKLLITIVLNKARLQADFHRAAKRNVGQETGSPAEFAALLTVDGQCDPQREAAIYEAAQKMFTALTEPNRIIVEMRLLGRSTEEIAEQTGRAPRSVGRVLEQARRRLEQEMC